MNCPRCQTPLNALDQPCPTCAAKAAFSENHRRSQSLQEGRFSILVVAIVSFAGALATYFLQDSRIDRENRKHYEALQELTPEARAELREGDAETLWKEKVAYDRKSAKVNLAVTIILAALFFGIWIWAGRNTLAAAITALALLLAAWGIVCILDPASLSNGILLRVFVIAFLAKAIVAGYRGRTPSEGVTAPPAR